MADKILKLEADAPMGGCCAPRARPRDRIVDTAQDLFHRHGIRGVGVDAIAEAAGTNKMTLYRHFRSKDDLIIEYLNYKGKKSDEIWSEIAAENPGDPVGQLRSFIHVVARYIAEDERGCDLANAATELSEADHPARRVIEEFKARQRARLVDLCRAAGAAPAEVLADTLALLIEGARVNRRSLGVEGPSATLVRACEAILATFGVDLGVKPERAVSAPVTEPSP